MTGSTGAVVGADAVFGVSVGSGAVGAFLVNAVLVRVGDGCDCMPYRANTSGFNLPGIFINFTEPPVSKFFGVTDLLTPLPCRVSIISLAVSPSNVPRP